MPPETTTEAAPTSWGIWPEASRTTLVRSADPAPPCPNPRDVRLVLMLGMHRSGTSALAGVLEACGLHLGAVNRESHAYNLKGHFSNSAIDALNEVLTTVPVAAEREPGSVHDEGLFHWFLGVFPEGAMGGMKDPEFNLTAPLWARHVARVTAVATLRHPTGVVRSIVARNSLEETVAKRRQFIEAWYAYNIRLLWMRRQFAFPIVDFDAPRATYLSQIAAVCAALGLGYDAGAAEAFIADDLIHNKGLEHEIELPRPVVALYNELLQYTLEPPASEWLSGATFVERVGHDIRPVRTANAPDAAIAAQHYETGINLAGALLHGQSLQARVDRLERELAEARRLTSTPSIPPRGAISEAQYHEAILLAEAYRSEIDRRDERIRKLHRENADLRNELQAGVVGAEPTRYQQAGGAAAG